MQVEVDVDNNEIPAGSPPQEEGAEESKRRTVIVDEHKGHYVKALNQVLTQAESEKHKLKDGIMEQTKKIEAAVSYFAGLEEIFSGQRDLFLKKLNADFDVMQKMIERKRSELIDKVSRSYDGHVRKTLNYKEGLECLQEVLTKIDKTEIRVDLDQINLNKATALRLREIENELDFEVQGNELDLINSRFINDPFKALEKCLDRFTFFPVQQQRINDIQRMFQPSRIVKPDHVTVDFLTEIIPEGLIKL